MSAARKRGLPEDETRGRRPKEKKGKAKRKRRRPLRFLLKLIALWVLVVSVYATVFVATKCYNRTAPTEVALEAGAEPVPGYTRPEVSAYLAVPNRVVVFSADEYAAFLATGRPSRFPYVGAARQYWSYYSSVCAVTRTAYPFERDDHVLLGILGTGFTVETTLKGAYEKTIGRFTEWLSSTETPEDAFAQRTAKEYAAFVHGAPWYRFPFWSKLRALWRETPVDGAYRLRKLERRVVLSVEYGAKAISGWLIGKTPGTAGDSPRIHARLDSAPATVFADGRVTQVKPLGPNSYLVTLPRHDEFTATALALIAAGARFLDIAGNDEIVVSALVRRGVSTTIADTRIVAVQPVLTDPTLQRLVLSAPVKALREVIAEIRRGGGTVEQLFDY